MTAEEGKKRASVETGVESVCVKLLNAYCTLQWGKKNERITSMLSINNVSVDGEPQHILDVLRVVESLDNETGKMIQATD